MSVAVDEPFTLPPTPPRAPAGRVRVLSLSGGGYRGLFTAAVMRALEARLDEARRILMGQQAADQGEKALRAYRLYLAGCALAFEHGWIALHQMLAARPSGDVAGGALRGAQSDYPFNRTYMYEDRSAARTVPGLVPLDP